MNERPDAAQLRHTLRRLARERRWLQRLAVALLLLDAILLGRRVLGASFLAW